METKEDLIRVALSKLLKISQLYNQIEENPINVEEGVSLTMREVHSIVAIGDSEPISITKLAGKFGITKSASSQMVAKLEKRAFIFKKQSPHSNKEYELSLTPLGWKAYKVHEEFHGVRREELIERLSHFSISQIATLSVLLEETEYIMEKCINE